METLGIIGVGNIATAILTGILKSGYITPKNISLFDLDCKKIEPLSTSYGVVACSTAEDVVKNSDYVLIAVKPSIVESVLDEISSSVSQHCIISVAAGISLSFISEHLPKDTAIIRAMPNTPLMYGCGAVAYAVGSAATEAQARFVEGIFSSSGLAVQVEEAALNSVTAVSGSSPAFVFRFIKNMVEEGMKQGLSEDVATKLVNQTVIGSAIMLRESGRSADELISMVASPNGTTEAGLKSLDINDFDFAIKSAIDKAYSRSIELTK